MFATMDCKRRYPSKLLTNNALQVVSKCFVTVCSNLEERDVTMTEYRLQSISQRERLSSTIAAELALRIRPLNKLEHLPATTNALSHPTVTEVYQGVLIQSGSYRNVPWAGDRRALQHIISVRRRHHFATVSQIGCNVAC